MTTLPTGAEEATTKGLRIACLLPSATDICVALGLSQQIVGITHECHFVSSFDQKIHILTRDGLQAANKSQMEIHVRVQQQQTCRKPTKEEDTTLSTVDESSIPSLYPIDVDALQQAAPNLIITQDLCAVCAPSVSQVKGLLLENDDTIRILSLSPHSLTDVLQTFVTVATACGIPQRGVQLRDTLQQQLLELKSTIQSFRRRQQSSSPRLLFLEWLDPPFDAGHWTLDMMEYADIQNAFDENHQQQQQQQQQQQRKSGVRSWDEITNTTRPDVILVACCGFNVERNAQDAVAHSPQLQRVLAASEKNYIPIYATNGDRYFTCPGPQLVTTGTVLLAMAAYRHEHPEMIEAIQRLPWVQAWLPEDLAEHYLRPVTLLPVGETAIADIEDYPSAGCGAGSGDKDDGNSIGHTNHLCWDKLHDEACKKGQLTYKDPDSGYSVFTELGLRQRGRCCGSGCRHCPYHHVNVHDKATKIQQPAWLFLPTTVKDNDVFTPLSQAQNNVRVLFFSGGKDSFLTIRALARHSTAAARFPLVLLTTFDATSRAVAHQEVPIQQIIQQAQHLQLPLLGVPLHRHHNNSNSLSYVQRIQQALTVIEAHVAKVTRTAPNSGDTNAIQSLVFGDLHLEHIRKWREEQLGGLYRLEFPLWKVDYETLAHDLELSGVRCIVSSSTVDNVQIGESYDALFRETLKERGPAGSTSTIDLFGENGEFHTLAQVWEVDRNVALGCKRDE